MSCINKKFGQSAVVALRMNVHVGKIEFNSLHSN